MSRGLSSGTGCGDRVVDGPLLCTPEEQRAHFLTVLANSGWYLLSGLRVKAQVENRFQYQNNKSPCNLQRSTAQKVLFCTCFSVLKTLFSVQRL